MPTRMKRVERMGSRRRNLVLRRATIGLLELPRGRGMGSLVGLTDVAE